MVNVTSLSRSGEIFITLGTDTWPDETASRRLQEVVVMVMTDEDDVFSVYRGPRRHERVLHPGWDSHPVRHNSHRLILQTEGKTNRNNTRSAMSTGQSCSLWLHECSAES